MGKKTVQRLAVLIGVIALLGGGGYLLWRFQVGRMAQGVVARADRAVQAGDFKEAAELYRQQLIVVPGDVDVQLKYAEAILKEEPPEKHRLEALEIFEGVVSRYPGHLDARRRAAEVAFQIGGGLLEKARSHLTILLRTPDLLKAAEDVGHLEYLMGRCCERDEEFPLAAQYYESSIKHNASERLEASQYLAILLRDKLDRAKEADRIVDEMVKSAPEDYRAYLGRGRYLEGSKDKKGAADDFRKALELAPDRPEVYLEVARAAERDSGPEAACRVLEKGLAAAPGAAVLYLAMAGTEQRAGRIDRAVGALERGLKELPDDVNLHWQLGMLLATRGDTGKVLMQVAELERLGALRAAAQYLRAYYHFNNREFVTARRILTALQPDVSRVPFLKAGANLLLSRCYAEMGEAEQERDAVLRAYSADPDNPAARQGYIQGLLARGDLDGAIREYTALLGDRSGAARLPLASLLIERNRRLPEAQARWEEVEGLIGDAAKAAPDSPEPALMRVRMLLARPGQEARAVAELEAMCKRFPADIRPWIIRADLLVRQRKFDEAQGLLKEARDRLGDRVDLRLAAARLAEARGGPQAVAALNDLTRGLGPFSREDRRRLIESLADALVRQRDTAGAARALSSLVEQEPESLPPRIRLFNLAIASGDAKAAEGQVRAIEGLDEAFGRICRAQLLVWRARGEADPVAKARARAEARGLLTELQARRPDWWRVPLALANLDEEELADAGTDEARKQEKLESSIVSYRRALELGLRDADVMRHYIQLLFRAGRGSEALEIYGQMPAGGPLPGELVRMASQVALVNRDYYQAAEIARKAVEANPKDFQARVWLAQVLLRDRKEADAEAVLRKAVADDPRDPDRWATLLRFMVLTRRPEQAKRAIQEAEASLAGVADAPLALAQSCEVIGKSDEAVDPDQARAWYARARRWFDAAEKAKGPGDPTVRRRLVEFLLQTNQAGEAEAPLKEILKRAADGRQPELAAWARRSLAQVYALAKPPRIAEAQQLLAGKAGAGGGDADDLRVLALIHEAQGTVEGRRQAIADFQVLIDRKSATPADRLRLALLLAAVGEWDRAREQFQDLIRLADDASDAETIARRPLYLALFIDALLRHHRAGDDSDLVMARSLVEKLKGTRDNELATLALEVRIDLAANRGDSARARIRDFADRPNRTVAGLIRLAEAANQLGLADAAEDIYRRVADEPPISASDPPNRARLAIHLARRGHVKEAIDNCERLWGDKARREPVIAACVEILCSPKTPVDAEQARRVVGWLERARGEGPPSPVLLVGLASLYERLGDYPRAEEVYRAAVRADERGDMAANAANNLAWLIAMRGDERNEALQLIQSAIQLRGPIPEFLDTRGMIFLKAGQRDRAVEDLEKALKGAPSPPKYFHLAQAYLEVNQKEKARQALEAGRSQGLPDGLHPLEQTAYNRVTSALGRP